MNDHPFLTPWQQAILEQYGDPADVLLDTTDYDEFTKVLLICGDGLLAFLMQELSPKEGCESAADAAHRLLVILDQVTAASYAVSNMQP